MENKLIKRKLGKKILMSSFDESMPIGNGRLGAMIPGTIGIESININEDSLWSTPFLERSNPEAKKHLKEIRQLLREGKTAEADKLCYLTMTSTPKYYGAYEPMCNIWAIYNHGEENVTEYERVLDLENAIANLNYTIDGLKVHRESFASYDYQTILFRIEADKPELDMQINLMRRPYENSSTDFVDKNCIHISGRAGEKGVKFDCVVSATTDGKLEAIGDYLHFENASQITLYIVANTDFYEEKPLEKCLSQLRAVMAEDYETVKAKHIADFSNQYNRAKIDFGTNSDDTVPEKLARIRSGKTDKSILELLFNFGKYLTLSASRPGSQATNLQGIWNAQYAAEWDSNYTININTEMNYWIAEIAQLSECHEPLFELLERMVPNGEKVAKDVYGCDGFVAHHATNLWGDAAIEGNSFPSSLWPCGGAWFIKHMWDHYLYTGDMDFLRNRAFPIMKKAALFFTQYMTEAEDGYFETGPSLSPENPFILEDGRKGMHCMAPEMDNQIVRSLFRSLVKTYEILDCRDDDYETYKAFMKKIRPTRINKNGCILEWDKDYKEKDPGHRHFSHLFALYPDYEITPEKTPELAKACENTIARRLSGSEIDFMASCSGWSGAWASHFYSRLKNGEKALEIIYTMLRVPEADGITSGLLSREPVFQIDGSFGLASAVAEMLIYSDEECVELLPALPEELIEGSFKGLCARGGFVLDVEWKDSKIIKASLTSRTGNLCRIKANGLTGVDAEFIIDSNYIEFKTEPGTTYELKFN